MLWQWKEGSYDLWLTNQCLDNEKKDHMMRDLKLSVISMKEGSYDVQFTNKSSKKKAFIWFVLHLLIFFVLYKSVFQQLTEG